MNVFYYLFIIQFIVLNDYIHAQFIQPPTNLDDYDAYGSLLAMNEYLSIIAQNDQEQFTIITYPFNNQSKKCLLPYDNTQYNIPSLTRFVYNVAIGAKQNASQLFFSYIDENWRRDVFLTITFLDFTDDNCVRIIDRIAINITDLNMREHAIVGMDPYGKRAYAVSTYYIQCIEIDTGIQWQFNIEQFFNNQNNFNQLFFPKAFVITEDHYLLIVGQRLINFKFLPYLYVLNFILPTNVTLASTIELSTFNFGPSAIDINRDSSISIAFLDEFQWFIIGIPRLDMVLILSWNRMNTNKEPLIIRKHISSQRGIYFGKSVALLDNNTFTILAHKLPTLPWSTSQIQLYSIYNEQLDNHPITIYPNNQQIIPSVNSVSSPHSILTLISWKLHIGLILDTGAALIISASPPGYYSGQIDDNIFDMSIYISIPCIPGTARNTTSFGPCFICPINMKNTGTSGIECESCVTNDTFLCLRGSLGEISLINITNYNQSIPYPNLSDLVVYDDILLQHIFSFMTESSHCLFISPLFWTLLAIGLGLIILLIMCILICFPQWKPQRTFLKKLFRHLDLIGEGELWFGGLMIFAIIVLIIFTTKFTISFIHLYPIETISSDIETRTACDTIYPNAKFSSVLQLLSITHHEEEQPIFTMLDKQNIILTIHMIGTGFSCQNITMQQNLDRGRKIPSNNFNCTYEINSSILSISTLLPEHLITIQFDLIGPYFIGGIRLCFSALSDINDNKKYTLEQLEFCQFFHENNQTLTMNPTFNVKMTKIINQTVGYTVNDDTIFSGRWTPSLTIDTLSDKLLFNEDGEYLRYLFDRFTLIIDMTESEFFIKNTQEPIARHAEIILHTVLFSNLFGLIFLIVKLIIIPLVEFIQQRYFSNRKQSLKIHGEHSDIIPSVPLSNNVILIERIDRPTYIENNTDITMERIL